jgi:2-oxoglutarate/2-oxoacid ferredoxin oxidoreductase subunit beta
MPSEFEFDHPIDMAWCPGCGNFNLHRSLMNAITQLGLNRRSLVFVSGIGQAAKTPQYLRVSYFNGLHGRSLPAATAIKSANPSLTVIAESGDGCTYGEGGNHFIHAIRRNPDITNIVHNNMVYALTKGQASPTSSRGFVTPVQITGVQLEPFNPLAVAIALNASFVARAFSSDVEKTQEILSRAIRHRGYALVDVFQPCVSFNRVNTHQWYKEHTYYLDQNHDPADREAAMKLALRTDALPLGVFYVNQENPLFEETLAAYGDDKRPLYQRGVDMDRVRNLLRSYSNRVA